MNQHGKYVIFYQPWFPLNQRTPKYKFTIQKKVYCTSSCSYFLIVSESTRARK